MACQKHENLPVAAASAAVSSGTENVASASGAFCALAQNGAELVKVLTPMYWLVRLICGCSSEEAGIALRLYWHEHRRRLVLIAVAELIVLAELIGLSYALIPIIVVVALIVVPRRISYPPALSMRALELPWRLWALALAVTAHAAYWIALEIARRRLLDAGLLAAPPNIGGANLLFQQVYQGPFSEILLLQIILLVVLPPILLLSFQRNPERLSSQFITAGAVWVACHLAWNLIYWLPMDIGPANPYGPQQIHYIAAEVLGSLTGFLIWYRRTRLVTFCLSCIVYTMIHILAWPIYLTFPHMIPTSYELSYCGLWSMGLPGTAWIYMVDVIK